MGRAPRELEWEARQALAGLRELAGARAELDRTIEKAVRRARSRPADVSWALIGDALGLTSQGAQKRYRDIAPKVRNRRKATNDET